MADYTADPKQYDHRLVIGDTYLVIGTLLDSAGAVYDITGATGTAKLRSEPGGQVIATPTVSLYTDGTDGKFQWTIAAATTAGLAPGRARYAVRLTFADSTVKTVVEGTIDIVKSAVD